MKVSDLTVEYIIESFERENGIDLVGPRIYIFTFANHMPV